MSSAVSVVLAPFEEAVSFLLVHAHHAFIVVGADPASATAWAGAVVALVFVVRAATLPLVVHQVRLGRAAAQARPELTRLAERYRGRTDVESLRAYRAEAAQVRREHGTGGLGCLPLLLQIPVMFALYRVLLAVSHHESVGAMTIDLVRLADAARWGGVSLGDTLGSAVAGGPVSGSVVISLVAAAALLTYATQRWLVLANTNLEDVPEQVASVQRLLPVISVVGLVAGAGAVPVGVLVYWVATNAWSLVQQWAINRVAPVPGSPAHAAWVARRAA